MSKVLDATALAKLAGCSVVAFHERALAEQYPTIVAENFLQFSTQDRFSLDDAIAIEVCMQLTDDGGLPEKVAARFVDNASLAIPSDTGGDYWIALMRNRNTWPNRPRGSWPVTGFGAAEYWSSGHFAGDLSSVTIAIQQAITDDSAQRRDSDPARIVLTNVSAAVRRLHDRAKKLGISLS